MKVFASLIAIAALAALVTPSRAIAGGTIQVTSGNVVTARPVGPQPTVVVVRPTVVPLAVGVPFTVGRPFTLAQPLLVARPFTVTQPFVGTQPIVIGQPFVITQSGMVQQQIVVPSSGVFLTSQGLVVVQ